MNRFRN